MEQTPLSMQWLYLIDRPAFCARDGKIIQVNQAAAQLLIEAGTEVSEILVTGVQEYADYTGGSLSLIVRAGGGNYGATVTQIAGLDVFQLDPTSAQAGLKAMALSARELRKPLSDILSASETLFSSDAVVNAPGLTEQTALINRGLYQLLRLVGNMSDVNRYSMEAPHLETRNLTSVFGEILERAQALTSQAGLTLRFQNLERAVYALADVEMLERAVYNMLSNAMKFSTPGNVITAKLSKSDRMLYFSVQDSGSGVPDSLRSSVFNRFQREPGIEDGRFGIGLGMALVRAAAAAHGGTVLVEYPEKKGLKITMTVSRRISDDPQVRTDVLHIDYAGERDHGLVELSDALPSSVYKNI